MLQCSRMTHVQLLQTNTSKHKISQINDTHLQAIFQHKKNNNGKRVPENQNILELSVAIDNGVVSGENQNALKSNCHQYTKTRKFFLTGNHSCGLTNSVQALKAKYSNINLVIKTIMLQCSQ